MTKQAHRSAHLYKQKQAKKARDPMDVIVYFFTFATPLFEAPQLIEIWSKHSAQDVSLWTWAFFCVDNLVWIVYAFRKRLMPVLITSLLFEVFEVGILLGVLLYR